MVHRFPKLKDINSQVQETQQTLNNINQKKQTKYIQAQYRKTTKIKIMRRQNYEDSEKINGYQGLGGGMNRQRTEDFQGSENSMVL